MNRLLIVGILIACILPLYAQGQPDPAKLKADAQKVASIISGDKAKTQTYCHLLELSDEFDQIEQKDRKKADDLSQKISELEKTLGPEYLELQLNTIDPYSREGEEIALIFEKLDESCPH